MFGSQSPTTYQIYDWFQGKPAVPRHPLWHKVRGIWLKDHGFCAVCGCTTGLNVHHIKPFHEFPELELEPENFITLGEICPTGNHHLLFGHLGDWRSWNVDVVHIANSIYVRMLNRPYSIEV